MPELPGLPELSDRSELPTARLDAVIHALAHGARRDMLSRLAVRELTVGELSAPLAMSQPAASKHVRILEDAGLLRRTLDGRRHVCTLTPQALQPLTDWLSVHRLAPQPTEQPKKSGKRKRAPEHRPAKPSRKKKLKAKS